MSSLWESDDNPDLWQETLDGYFNTINKLAKPKLLDLDRWYFEDFCLKLNENGLSKDDMIKLVDWKLTRGKWRPRLLDFAKQAPEGQVKDAWIRTAAILKIKTPCPLPAIKEALAALTELKGVGPATASAVLSAADPSIPFMSDEALVAACGSRDYTVKQALELTEKMRKKADTLNKVFQQGNSTTVATASKAKAGSGSKKVWTVRDVERCLYAEAVEAKVNGAAGKKQGGASSVKKDAKRKSKGSEEGKPPQTKKPK